MTTLCVRFPLLHHTDRVLRMQPPGCPTTQSLAVPLLRRLVSPIAKRRNYRQAAVACALATPRPHRERIPPIQVRVAWPLDILSPLALFGRRRQVPAPVHCDDGKSPALIELPF